MQSNKKLVTNQSAVGSPQLAVPEKRQKAKVKSSRLKVESVPKSKKKENATKTQSH